MGVAVIRMRRAVGAALGVAVLLLAGCGRAEPPPLVPHEVAATTTVDPAAPCTREAAPGAADESPTPPSGQVVVDPAGGRIVLGAGPAVSLPALGRAVHDPALLRETAPGEWFLGADLEIAAGASLTVTAPAVRRLDLSSTPGRVVAVRVLGGSLAVAGTCVTSWDGARADTDIADGRSFLLARDGAAMTVDHAEVRFLGFGDVESYGLSWRTAGTTGQLTNSIVSNLYYGVYSFEVGGLVVTDNEVFASTVYGIDPHTGSHDLTIARNVVHDNGKHGIILAEDCVDSVVADNVVYANQQHGIVLFLRSDRNVVERNDSFRNAAKGIDVNESARNVVRENRVYDNAESGITVGQDARDTAVEHNVVRRNQQDGVRVVSQAERTAVRDNVIGDNVRYGIYVDVGEPVEMRGNTIFRSRYGIAVAGGTAALASGNTLFANTEGEVRDTDG